LEVVVQPRAPILPVQPEFLARPVGGQLLDGFLAVAQVEPAHLRVGHDLAVDEQGAADTCAEGENHDHAFLVFARAEDHLGQASHVGVVAHRRGPAGGVADALGQVHVVPAGESQRRGRRHHPAVHDHGRKADANRPAVVELLHQCLHRADDLAGLEGRGRRQPQPLGHQFARGRVDNCSLNA